MSLSIGAHVYKKLSDSTELAKLISDKIYAISTKTEISFPFVIYRRNSLVPEYTKIDTVRAIPFRLRLP